MKRDSWGSRLGFMLAVAGSAVGLANIWRFPYIVGQNGGAAFILIYILFLCLIGFPVFMSEILIGRTTQTSPSGAFDKLGGSRSWSFAGKLTILTGFIVSAFYSAVAGWVLGYLVEALKGNLSHFTTSQQTVAFFDAMIATPWWGVSFHFFFIAICSAILFFGVREGIERGSKIMMPLLFIMLFLLVLKGLTLPNAGKALTYLFSPDWSLLTPKALIIALGQAFFTLSLGQGTMVTYGSYLKKHDNLISSCAPVVLVDLLVSIFSAIAVFTIVFSVDMQPDSGPGLIFHTLPWVFSQLPAGTLLAIIFFILVVLAAITSEISAMEPTITYLQDERGWSRRKAVFVTTAGAFALGVPAALSFSTFSGVSLLGLPILDFMEVVCSNYLIPLGGLLAVILVGWVWGFKSAYHKLQEGSTELFDRNNWLKVYFWICIKYISPAFILIIFLNAIGIF